MYTCREMSMIPLISEYVFSGHGLHKWGSLPVFVLYVPAGQSRHRESLLGPHFPRNWPAAHAETEHGEHVVGPVLLFLQFVCVCVCVCVCACVIP